MPRLTTIEVLKVLDDHIFGQTVRCGLLKSAVRGMIDDDEIIRPGCDIMIEQHLSDMMYFAEHPQNILSEHVEYLKSLVEMCKPQQPGDTGRNR